MTRLGSAADHLRQFYVVIVYIFWFLFMTRLGILHTQKPFLIPTPPCRAEGGGGRLEGGGWAEGGSAGERGGERERGGRGRGGGV